MSEYSPHYKFIDKNSLYLKVKEYAQNHKKERLTFLDVGGGSEKSKVKARWESVGFDYTILECDKNTKAERIVYADICECPEILNDSYDIVYSNNVFEHLNEPWKAAEEISRILKFNGLTIHTTVFSWRYHPVPVDMFRYTSDGLKYLFERTGKIITILSGYDIEKRRKDDKGGKIGILDIPPIDELGGWRENWQVMYVGEKNKISKL
jgi:SAM-dependent methyltransferase